MFLRRSTWKRLTAYSAIVAATVGITAGIGAIGLVKLADLKASDAQFVLRGRIDTSKIVLVTADQRTYDNIRDVQLFWHPYYAEAIRAAADGGAKVMALDVTFTVPVEKWERDHDRLLAEAVAESTSRMPVITGFVPRAMSKQQEWPIPVNMISSALGLAAFVNLTADPDSFVRRQELFEAPTAAENAPVARALSLLVAEKYLETDAQLKGNELRLDGRRIPLSADRTLTINYAGPAGTFPSVPLWDFLQAARKKDAAQLRQWVQGKIVLLGVDSITDRYPTPYYTAFAGNRWTTAGVEIHANTIQTLLSRSFLIRAPLWGDMLAVLVVTLGTVAATARMGSFGAGVWVTCLLAAILISTHVLFLLGVIVSVSKLLIACGCSMLLTGVYRLSTAQKRTEFLGRALNVFVGRNMASSLDEWGGISLTGKHQFVTILFSDIRGFTTFCEEKDPGVVVGVLNSYLAAMVGIVTAHRGSVNKFIGDGILAVFSDDDGSVPGDHPIRAVRCGIAMCQADTGFQTGVGIHTGIVVIGNIGSADRVEYTVLGDTVNLASRIEGLNKERKTSLLMSQATNALLDGHVETVSLGMAQVRGQTRMIELYTPLDLMNSTAASAARHVN